MDLCFLDIETTGFEPQEDSIIELSFVRYKDGKKINEYDQVFQTDKSALNDFVVHLTGINQQELDADGQVFAEQVDHIKSLIEDSVIVGHNIDFDIRFLLANGVDIAENPRLDTHELSRILLPLEASFALEVLSQKYGFTHKDAHRAMSDVLASKDLFALLLSKIADLPQDYLTQIRPVLESHTDWYAKKLFLESAGVPESKFYQKSNFQMETEQKIDGNLEIDLSSLSAGNSQLVRIGENKASADKTLQIAQKLVREGKKVLLVSPKLDYFADVPMFPTPEVLLDPDRLQEFVTSREKLDNLETTFYLQCRLRQAMSFRGVFFFDLFFKMRNFWEEVRQINSDNMLFQAVLEEKSAEPILALSPQALFRFSEHFTDRVLIIDEAEVSADRLLHAPTHTLNFSDWKDETALSFFMARFCKEVIEPNIGHQIGPFGAKILLKESDRFPDFVNDLESFLSGEDLQKWQDFLSNPAEKLTRWIMYFPDSGRLSWHAWHPDDWRAYKETLQKCPKILLHRYPFAVGEDAFWRIFFGLDKVTHLADVNPQSGAMLTIPTDLVSQSSPDFNASCSHRIAEAYGETDKNLTVNFSSIETMRSCFDDLTQTFIDDENFSILGEKVSGGQGKMMQMLEQRKDKKLILCTQKILNPKLNDFETDTLVMQKFPFGAPHPLFEKIESVMKQSGQSWWDLWVVPQLVANLHRRVGNFSGLEKIIWLDPRENSKWGKVVLRKVFGSWLWLHINQYFTLTNSNCLGWREGLYGKTVGDQFGAWFEGGPDFIINAVHNRGPKVGKNNISVS